MEDEFGMADLRQYINGKPFFPTISQPLSSHRGLPYDMLMFRSDSAVITPTGNNTGDGASAAGGGGGDGCTARWPRQETLTLLEIRSRLDAKFKEANQKGPLWDQLSRIMSEEYGYHRSGKKCREKFENLYKYYKKTKDGKSGRQDGKHYRFFRQLEALYGEPSNNSSSASETRFNGGNFLYTYPNNNPELYPGPKLSDASPNSSGYDATSSDSNAGGGTNYDEARKKMRSSIKARIKDSIDEQMEKLMEKQEAWMQKMMSIIEEKERERMLREEQWRKQDEERIDREHKLWASERAWIEARDFALMEAFQKLTGKELRENEGSIWPESEVTRLIQLRVETESKFRQDGISEQALWDEIAAKMACYGHQIRSGFMCKQKWDSVNNYILKCNKKRKENSIYDHCQGFAAIDHGNSTRDNTSGDHISDVSCLRYFIGDSCGRL